MPKKKKISKQKKRNSITTYKIGLKDKIYVSDLLEEDKKRIYNAFNQKKHLPFYKSSGTSVFTSRKPSDFEELFFYPSEFKNYFPRVKKFKTKQKKHSNKKKTGKN